MTSLGWEPLKLAVPPCHHAEQDVRGQRKGRVTLSLITIGRGP